MSDNADIYKALKKPFPKGAISWRAGATNAKKNGGVATKCIALAYIDARDVMNRLDEVFGLEWSASYSHADSKTICEISVRVGDMLITRAGGAGDTDIEAEKGAISDAFKRAAVLWGIGRYLYELPNEWVECDEWKHIKVAPELPQWATPLGFDSGLTPYGNIFGEVKTRNYDGMIEEVTAVFKNTEEGKQAAFKKWSAILPELQAELKFNVEAQNYVWFGISSNIRKAIKDLQIQTNYQEKQDGKR